MYKFLPSSVDKLHRLDCEHRRDDVIRVVTSTTDNHEALATSADEDEATRSQEAEQTGAHERQFVESTTVRIQRLNLIIKYT